jgi:hypothetical protein
MVTAKMFGKMTGMFMKGFGKMAIEKGMAVFTFKMVEFSMDSTKLIKSTASLTLLILMALMKRKDGIWENWLKL